MSYMMCARITFRKTEQHEELQTHFVSSVKIESSWKMLTDTAEIVLPRKKIHHDGKELSTLLKVGDAIKIELGYNTNYITEFEGYILSISKGTPLTILCEDEMYKLKRKTVSYSKASVSLLQLLKDIAGEYEIKTSFADTQLGAVRYSNVRVSEIFEDLRKIGLNVYFEGKVLMCGDVYTDKVQREVVKIHLEKQAVSQDLNETSGEYEVVATAMLRHGEKLEAKAGTKGAETFRIKYSDKEDKITKEILQDFATRFYERLKKQKYKGGVELFGTPSVQHGLVLALTSDINAEMSGKYFIEKVTKEFSDNATFRQKIELGGIAE